jgi:signal transduction histidine kinase
VRGRSLPGRLVPRGMTGQLVLLVLAVLVLGQIAAFWIFADERRAAIEGLRWQQSLDRLSTVVRVLRAAPPELHARLAEAAEGPELGLRLTAGPPGPPDPASPAAGFVRPLAERLGVAPEQVRIEPRRRQPGRAPLLDPDRWRGDDRPHRWGRRWRPVVFRVELGPGRWLEAVPRPGRPPLGLALPSLVAWLLTAVGLVAVVIVTARRVGRPARALALAADRLGRGEAAEPLPERGPDEIRRATRAFNEMQARLRRFVDDRTRLLAALGHDLRTPITALRLRAELVEEDEARERLLETLAEMQAMVEATLAFARDEAASEPSREVDLAALVEGLCEDLRELGRDVAFVDDAPRLVARVRPLALRRALRNLLENAVAYGARARVALAREDREAVVTIDDDGPGVPADQLERVFEPFVRLEASRSRETGGVGLGLAIARSVVRAHGGEVALANREGGGLRATVRLPVGTAEGLPTRASRNTKQSDV